MDDEGDTDTVANATERARPADLAEVTLPARFKPLRILGAGAMGYVVEAHDKTLGREVAVKVIAAKRLGDARARTRFMREARAAAALRHPNIVTVFDLDPLGKFIVMELVAGETLKQRIERGPLALDEVRHIGDALLAAIATAHDAGVVHRDIKPANVLLGADGSIKLADFGVAGTADSELTATGEVIGTPAYMAPEQLRGLSSDARVDIYAAGATLFEAATGQRLHSGRDRANTQRRVREAIGDRSLAAAIARAVSDDPADRFADARAFARELSARPRHKRWPWLVVAGVFAATASIAVGRLREAPMTSFERGRAALDRHDYATAEKNLRAATRDSVDAAKAHYYLAIQYWWTSHATPQVIEELDRAIALGIDERLTAVARGVRALVLLEYPSVIETFESLAKQYPNDRDVLYGLFEALFHGGRPAEAMLVYRRLRSVAPAFGLGRTHALGYWLARGELENARYALDGAVGVERVRWQARIDVAANEIAGARARLEAARAQSGERDAHLLAWELAAVHAVSGELDRARELAGELSTRDMRSASLPLLALAVVRGTTTSTDAPAYLWNVAINAMNVPSSIMTTTREGWIELATFIAIDGDIARARTALANLPRDLDRKMLENGLARVMMSGIVGDRDMLRACADNPFPEVRAAAAASLAALDGDHRGAAEHWRHALAADGFGRFRVAESLHLARALVAAHEHAAAVAACADVIRPRLFHWSWGLAVTECRGITAGRTQP